MSYYEQKIAALEARIEKMALRERMKAIPVEKQLMVRIGELNDENTRLKAEVDALKAERELKNAAIEVILNAAKQGGQP